MRSAQGRRLQSGAQSLRIGGEALGHPQGAALDHRHQGAVVRPEVGEDVGFDRLDQAVAALRGEREVVEDEGEMEPLVGAGHRRRRLGPRHVLGATAHREEIRQLDRPAVFQELEVVAGQAGDPLPVAAGDVDLDVDHLDVDRLEEGLFPGLGGFGRHRGLRRGGGGRCAEDEKGGDEDVADHCAPSGPARRDRCDPS